MLVRSSHEKKSSVCFRLSNGVKETGPKKLSKMVSTDFGATLSVVGLQSFLLFTTTTVFLVVDPTLQTLPVWPLVVVGTKFDARHMVNSS